jgi:hypothetical protein
MQLAPSAKTEQEIFTDYINEINPPQNFDGDSPVGTSDQAPAHAGAVSENRRGKA